MLSVFVWGNAYASGGAHVISMQVDNPDMTVDRDTISIDGNRATVPLIRNDRILFPIRAIMEEAGRTVDWDNTTKETILTYGDTVIRLTADSTTAYLNDEAVLLDCTPAIINERIMMPVRFVAESFGFEVNRDVETETVTLLIPDPVNGFMPTMPPKTYTEEDEDEIDYPEITAASQTEPEETEEPAESPEPEASEQPQESPATEVQDSAEAD